MKDFHRATVEWALSQVKTEEEAMALAEMLMKIDYRKSEDAVWKMSEQRLLAALIWSESQSSGQRCFTHILAVVEQGNFDALKKESICKSLFENQTDNFHALLAAGLQARLADFRHCTSQHK